MEKVFNKLKISKEAVEQANKSDEDFNTFAEIVRFNILSFFFETSFVEFMDTLPMKIDCP